MSCEPKKIKLRSDHELFLVGNMEHQIIGAKLPSNRQVLQVYEHNKRIFGLDKNESARLVIQEVMVYWSKARIPISAQWFCIKKLGSLHSQWESIIKSKHRRNQGQSDAEDSFRQRLDNLFDIAAKDALEQMKDDVDKAFLIAQRKPGREGCLLGFDKKGQEKEESKQQRIDAEERRRKKAEADRMTYEHGNID